MSAIRKISDEAFDFEDAMARERRCWVIVGMSPITGETTAIRDSRRGDLASGYVGEAAEYSFSSIESREFSSDHEAREFIRLHAVQVALDALKAKDGSDNPPS